MLNINSPTKHLAVDENNVLLRVGSFSSSIFQRNTNGLE